MPKQPEEPTSWVIEKFEHGHAVLQGKAGRLVIPRHQISTKAKVVIYAARQQLYRGRDKGLCGDNSPDLNS